MKKYLLPSALILLLGLGYALAQTIVRAVQLSQDTSGAFSIDSNNGFYFPGHVLTQGSPLPTVVGNSSPVVTGTDFAGVITVPGTTVTVLFGRVYLSIPYCVLSNQVASAVAYTTAPTGINVTSIAAGGKVNYFCSGLN